MAIEQRIGRIDRIGQTREVFVFNLVTAGTIEDEVLRIPAAAQGVDLIRFVTPTTDETTQLAIRSYRGIELGLGQADPGAAICAKLEAEMSEMSDEDRQMFLEELGQTEPGLNRLIRSAYSLLGLQTYFTAGVKEVRAWTIHVGDTGPQAAGVIHTDFEKGYIRAQTIAFDDFIAFKGEQGAKDAGKMRAEGKEYVVKDGDVMNFLFSS